MTILDCEICGHALMDHDLKAGADEARCQMLVSDHDDPTEGDHRGGCPRITEGDTCGCPGYQVPQVFSYDQVVELLRLFGATITIASRPSNQPTDRNREAA
jgi:hypothetical protein